MIQTYSISQKFKGVNENQLVCFVNEFWENSMTKRTCRVYNVFVRSLYASVCKRSDIGRSNLLKGNCLPLEPNFLYIVSLNAVKQKELVDNFNSKQTLIVIRYHNKMTSQIIHLVLEPRRHKAYIVLVLNWWCIYHMIAINSLSSCMEWESIFTKNKSYDTLLLKVNFVTYLLLFALKLKKMLYNATKNLDVRSLWENRVLKVWNKTKKRIFIIVVLPICTNLY